MLTDQSQVYSRPPARSPLFPSQVTDRILIKYLSNKVFNLPILYNILYRKKGEEYCMEKDIKVRREKGGKGKETRYPGGRWREDL